MSATPTRRRILAAALDCIERQGVERLSLVEVAEVAGLGRQTVYRHFSSRDRLLTEALVSRIDDIVVQLRPVSKACSDLKEALVVLNVASVQAVMNDGILSTILEQSGDRRLQRFMTASESPLADQTMQLWAAHLSAARSKRQIRDGLTDDDIGVWIRAVQLIVLLRDDLDADGQARMFASFVVPAICKA